jgi:hypothetical protein
VFQSLSFRFVGWTWLRIAQPFHLILIINLLLTSETWRQVALLKLNKDVVSTPIQTSTTTSVMTMTPAVEISS